MNFEFLLNQFENRILWITMKSILKACGIECANGWAKTKLKLKEYEKDNAQEAKHKLDKLQLSYSNHLLIGEKAVRVFEINKEEFNVFLGALKKINLEDNAFSEKYPFSLPEDELDGVDSIPKLVEKRELDNGNYALVYCTKRVFPEKVVLQSRHYEHDQKKELINSFKELIGYREYLKQLYDVIFFRENELKIEIRIDIGQGVSSSYIEQAFTEIINIVNELAFTISNIKNLIKEPINFFPIIDKLYNSKDEGRIVELWFKTDEGSTKHEKVRKKQNDARDDTYHKGGIAAVSYILLFKLAVLWKLDLIGAETKPELFLPGKAHMAGEASAILPEVIISGCGGLEDYEFVFNKINFYLND